MQLCWQIRKQLENAPGQGTQVYVQIVRIQIYNKISAKAAQSKRTSLIPIKETKLPGAPSSHK